MSMWGKNGDDSRFHYFESLSDGRYKCGKTQRAKNIRAVEIPEGLCPQCHRYYRAELKRTGGRMGVGSVAAPTLMAAPQEPATEQADVSPARHGTVGNRSVRLTRYAIDREFEKQYLTRVVDLIDQKTAGDHDALQSAKKALRKVGSGNFLDGAVGSWRVTSKEEAIEVLRSQRATPYFARIDFQEESSDDGESLYIGRSSVTDEQEDLLVLDWRAPICSIYYGYNIGPASYLAPAGMIRGEILLKRQYRIESGRLHAIYDASGNLDGLEEESVDEMLLSLLKRNTTGKMRQIVQSIQAEQDAIIRSEGDILVVQGPAGSGKTIIALHRAAYLLYHMRLESERLAKRYDHISAQRMIVFSPNSIFSDYISRVLPDLHEGQIRQVLLEQHLHGELTRQLRRDGQGASFYLESKEDHYEAALASEDRPNAALYARGAALKSSVAMLLAIEQQHARIEADITDAFFDVPLNSLSVAPNRDQTFYSRDEMARQFRSRPDAISLTDRIASVLKEFGTRINDISKRAYVQSSTTRQLEQERHRLEASLKQFQNRSLIDLYLDLWRDTGSLERVCREEGMTFPVEEIAKATERRLREGRIAYEDQVPLLLVSGHHRGFPMLPEVDHAVVDEAQDYSLPHYEYIKSCLPDRCSLTIVGDVNQAISPQLNLHDYEGLSRVFGGRIRRLELTRSYRSSQEVTDFASGILPGSPRIDNVRRSGSRPKLVAATSERDRVDKISRILETLAASDYGTVALLCKTRQECEALQRSLSSNLSLILITDRSGKLGQGVCVMPVHLAKGLEFDAVVLHDAGEAIYRREEERKMLYTACTRALHELYICYTGELTPLLSASAALCDRLTL